MLNVIILNNNITKIRTSKIHITKMLDYLVNKYGYGQINLTDIQYKPIDQVWSMFESKFNRLPDN